MNSSEKLHSRQEMGTARVGKLLARFAVPAIIGTIVSAAYNIVDQIFIGHGVGMLGNAATNVAFPVVTVAASISLLMGIGASANFNLELGRGNNERAAKVAGNGVFWLLALGIIAAALLGIFIKPLVTFFGADAEVYPYALEYTGITVIGVPFLVFSVGACHIIRADGSPRYSMFAVLAGAVLNTILDPIFIFVCKWGIAGAAWATVISQIVSAVLAGLYFIKFKSVKLSLRDFLPNLTVFKAIAALGLASSFNQIALTVMQIVLNNTLRKYGALSAYGSAIPLAAAGVLSKVSMVFMAVMIGLSQGLQPISGYNYGAKNYERVMKTYAITLRLALIIGAVFLILFETAPRPIISIFGSAGELPSEMQDLYFKFAVRYFRIFFACTLFNGIQPITSGFMTSIGKAAKGMLLSLTRQIIFLIPLMLILPIYLGIDGVVYAGPIADAAACIVAFLLVLREFKLMKKLSAEITAAKSTEISAI